METHNPISAFVKQKRKSMNLTQEELAAKAGVGLRFIRELEQGKTSLRTDKVNQVLDLFGYQLLPQKGMEAYDILLNYFNKNVKVLLKNKTPLVGFFIKEHSENNEIRSWDFIQNINAIEYQQTQNKGLITPILHEDIEKVELVQFNSSKS